MSRRRPGRDPGAGDHPVDVPRLAAAERTAIKQNLTQGEGGAGGVGRRRPEDDARVPERPDDQRRPVRVDGAEGPGEPAGGRLQHRARRLADRRTWLPKYRDGKMAFGLSLWGPDYPDPADYLAFTPGRARRHCAPAGRRAAIRRSRSSPPRRASRRRRRRARTIYRQIQRRLNQRRPVLPADAADAGLRLDEGSEGRGLQRGVPGRRHAGGAEVESSCSRRGRRDRR